MQAAEKKVLALEFKDPTNVEEELEDTPDTTISAPSEVVDNVNRENEDECMEVEEELEDTPDTAIYGPSDYKPLDLLTNSISEYCNSVLSFVDPNFVTRRILKKGIQYFFRLEQTVIESNKALLNSIVDQALDAAKSKSHKPCTAVVPSGHPQELNTNSDILSLKMTDDELRSFKTDREIEDFVFTKVSKAVQNVTKNLCARRTSLKIQDEADAAHVAAVDAARMANELSDEARRNFETTYTQLAQMERLLEEADKKARDAAERAEIAATIAREAEKKRNACRVTEDEHSNSEQRVEDQAEEEEEPSVEEDTTDMFGTTANDVERLPIEATRRCGRNGVRCCC